jgi:hypothetical protein
MALKSDWLQEGGVIMYDDGKEVEIEPHSERVWLEVWHNGTTIETLCYSRWQDGNMESDRIHLVITPDGGERMGWLMNIEDANAIVMGLSRAISRAIELGIPVSG